jgi:hypothetical protein
MIRILALATAFAVFAAVSLAAADTVTRDSYTAAVEPICKKNSQANKRIFKNVRKLVRKGKLKPAAKRFVKASKALKRTYRQLKAVPQPAADEARLARWLGYVKTEANLFVRVAKKLKHNQRGAAQNLVNKLTTNANAANSTVLPFNFRYCRFNPSQFT